MPQELLFELKEARYENVGDVLVAQGKLDEALNSYRDGLAMRELKSCDMPVFRHGFLAGMSTAVSSLHSNQLSERTGSNNGRCRG